MLSDIEYYLRAKMLKKQRHCKTVKRFLISSIILGWKINENKMSYDERSQWQLLLLKHVVYSENYKRHTSSVVYLLSASLVHYGVLYNWGWYEY